MYETAIGKLWADLRDGLIPVVKKAAEVRAAPPRHAAERLLSATSALQAAGESAAQKAAAVADGDQGSHPHLVQPLAPLPRRTKRPDPADEFLKDIYGDRYHSNGSTLAHTYARSLARIPEKFHRAVADYMKESPLGGIWLGDTSLLELGHPEWSAATRGEKEKPEGWPEGTTWNDVGGAYDLKHRVLLAGKPYESVVALHEFGHAVDDAFGMPSQAPAFARVHADVVSLIPYESSESAAYFAQPEGVGEAELFAHGWGWFHDTHQPDGFVWFDNTQQPRFFDSVAAGYHLTDYYQALLSRIELPL